MGELQQQLAEVLRLQLEYSAQPSLAMSQRRELIMDRLVPTVEESVREVDPGGSLRVAGSSGIGNPAKVPWVRVFDPAQSPTATMGWYIVWLFAADGSSVALSLNQGVTRLSATEIAQRVTQGRRLLAARSEPELPASPPVEAIQLQDPGLGRRYEKGHLTGFQYSADRLPDDETLVRDLSWLVEKLVVLPPLEEVEDNGSDAIPVDDLATLTSAILWTEDEVAAVFEGLMDESPQVILTGPPGTGKTFVAQHLAAYLLGMPGEIENNPYIEIVQFHPSYGYEDFVEGLRPIPGEAGGLEFQATPGVLVRLADEMAIDGHPRVLIIDEMNRANIPKVFGELMYLLEYRDQDIRLMHRESFSLPRNLYIIGTMNAADRSANGLDLALRRRFDFFDIRPSAEILRRFYALPGNVNALGESLFAGFEALNESLTAQLDRHLSVGHSYFMKSSMTRAELKRRWDHQIWPLIEDYFFDRPSLTADYDFDSFWPLV